MSTAPADREAAVLGVSLAYQAAGLSPPKHIVWCASPIEMFELWRQASRDQAGASVGSAIVSRVRDRVVSALCRCVTGQALAAVARLIQPVASGTIDGTVKQAVMRCLGAVHAPALERGRWLFWVRPWLRFVETSYAWHDLAWLELHEYFRNICDLRAETELLRGLLLIAANVSWMLPHRHICWLAEHPLIFHSDARGRLHSAAGPALQFRDGWPVYAWKDVEVPRRIIDQPEQITRNDIDRASVHVRRCMIDRLTQERYMAFGDAVRVSEDETGLLWQRRWADGDMWAAVEVLNGTPEPDGTRRRYFLQVPPHRLTARSAVAWTYGLTERQYRGLVLRT